MFEKRNPHSVLNAQNIQRVASHDLWDAPSISIFAPGTQFAPRETEIPARLSSSLEQRSAPSDLGAPEQSAPPQVPARFPPGPRTGAVDKLDLPWEKP